MTDNLEFNTFVPQDFLYKHLTYPEYAYPWERVREEIVRVYIAEGCTAISWRSFCEHKNLREVSIPKGVTEIQEQAFQGCISLQSLLLPDSLKKIGAGEFAPCGKLE